MIKKAVRQIHGSFIVGLLLFAGVAYNKVQNQNQVNPAELESLQSIAPIIGIVMGIVGQFLSRSMVKDFKPGSDKKRQYLEKYQTVKLIQWASVEAGALMNLSLYFTGGNSLNLYSGLGLALVITALYPSEKDFFRLFKISEKDLEEKSEIDTTF